MSSSDLSSLSSPPSSDEEPPPTLKPLKTLKLSKGKLTAAPRKKKATPLSPEPEPVENEREPSPPHEYVLADNPDIPILVMFRARFADAFPKNVHHFGPQDLERSLVESTPGEQIENLLCAFLGLSLNRKKPPERGHHGRALEEALGTHKGQWPKSWEGKNPIHGSQSFQTMNPTQRLHLLRTLMTWCLSSSEQIRAMMADAYKQSRHDDDLNQPLSVQPWGVDGRKRKYWLIEGQNDTCFRLYRQNPPKGNEDTWWSIAGTIEELKAVAEEVRTDGSQAGRRLADRFIAAVPRLEGSEERRKKREYRQARRAAFARPEPGFSLYEGRTRGKRMKYTFSDDEDDESDSVGVRRSARQSGMSTPAEPAGPTVTASGRQVRSRFGKSYGEPMSNGYPEKSRLSREIGVDGDSESEAAPRADGRARRSGRSQLISVNRANSDVDMDDEEDPHPSGEEWDGDDEDFEGKNDKEETDESDDDLDESSSDELAPKSFVVTLKYRAVQKDTPNREANGDSMDIDREVPDRANSSPPKAESPQASTLVNGISPHQTSDNGPVLPPQPSPSTLPSISSLVNPPSTDDLKPTLQHSSVKASANFSPDKSFPRNIIHHAEEPTKPHLTNLLSHSRSTYDEPPKASNHAPITPADGMNPPPPVTNTFQSSNYQPVASSAPNEIQNPTFYHAPPPLAPSFGSKPAFVAQAQGEFTLPQRSPPPNSPALVLPPMQVPMQGQEQGGSGTGMEGR